MKRPPYLDRGPAYTVGQIIGALLVLAAFVIVLAACVVAVTIVCRWAADVVFGVLS